MSPGGPRMTPSECGPRPKCDLFRGVKLTFCFRIGAEFHSTNHPDSAGINEIELIHRRNTFSKFAPEISL